MERSDGKDWRRSIGRRTLAVSSRCKKEMSKEEMKMTDPALHIGDNSPEYVAYRLMLDIAKVEKKALTPSASCQTADRKWVLDTYAECLRIVRSPQARR
jgi:hypothetical protein